METISSHVPYPSSPGLLALALDGHGGHSRDRVISTEISIRQDKAPGPCPSHQGTLIDPPPASNDIIVSISRPVHLDPTVDVDAMLKSRMGQSYNPPMK